MDVQSLEWAAAGLAALGVATFCLGLARMGRRQSLDQRMQAHVGLDRWGAVAGRGDAPDLPDLRIESERSTGLSHRLTRSALGATVQARLMRAGLALEPSQFILIQAAGGCLAALLAAIMTRSAHGPVRLLAAAALAGAGSAAPLLVLGLREAKRVAAFEKQLPQAIDSMAGTLQAGSALPQAMESIAREMPPPISVEFRRVLREMELGLSLTDSLAHLQSRVRSADMELVTSAIAIQQRVGGDLAAIFRGISHTIRERLRIRSEINVLTAQGRFSAYVITALPVGLFLYLWITNYAYISQLFLPGVTRVLLVCGIVGMILGFLSMKKIVSIEV